MQFDCCIPKLEIIKAVALMVNINLIKSDFGVLKHLHIHETYRLKKMQV